MSCPYKPSDSATAECPYKPDTQDSQHKGDQLLSDDALTPIPQPPAHWFVGNLPEMDPSFPLRSVWRLANIYGEIYKIDLVAREQIVVSGYDLINEVLDTSRFVKQPTGILVETRALLGDGLFSSDDGGHNWGVAHRVLMPVFGPLAIKQMFPKMQDLISQMILRWDRMGPKNEIEASNDFTRLAFDVIGLSSFSYRFNSFYGDTIHPFAIEMGQVLIECGKRANRTAVENALRYKSAQALQANIQSMWKLCDDIIAERRANPQPEAKDILNAMILGRDPETGERMTDESIRYNMVTFLVAGHETTSGTLSFLFYLLLKNPETYYKAQAEVDRVVGDDVLKPEHLPKFQYIQAAIREALRVESPIGAHLVKPLKDTLIGGKYRVKETDSIQCNIRSLHHDQKIWGPDADEFRPERLMDGGWEKLPPNAWKPFGNGARACIGRALAEQEMLMAVPMILQRFHVTMADPAYELRLNSTLTIKPADFRFKVVRRPGRGPIFGIPGDILATADKASHATAEAHSAQRETEPNTKTGKSLLILYGSNSGTCKFIAEDLETIARDQGFSPQVKTMDEGTEQLPKNSPVVIVTPSYEGKPADNARKFVAWLESSKPESMDGVSYAVFGVGNSEWVTSYFKIPKLVSETMEKLGAKQIIPTRLVDVKEDLIGPWEDWRDEFLAASGGASGASDVGVPELDVSIAKPGTVDILAGDTVSTGIIKMNKKIAGTEVGPEKRHIEIELPEGATYEPGDYLVVLPTNPPDVINRVCNRFGLALDDVMTIKGTTKQFLAGSGPSTVVDIIGTRVELSIPASKRQIEAIAKTASEVEASAILHLVSSDDIFKKEVIDKRFSVLDILEDYPQAKLSFAAFLDMLRPLTPRQYSISSSPLATLTAESSAIDRAIASLTIDVHHAPARSGHGRVFEGVASTYLAKRNLGARIRCFVRRSNAGFHLPKDSTIPVILIAAGSGLAPMRGFLQHRASLKKPLGPALLYFGCRDFENDYIYADELREWERQGVVSLRPTFSQRGPSEGKEGFKYAYERIWAERDEVRDLFMKGGKVFLCGSASKLGKSTNETCKKVWLVANPGKTEDEAQQWLDGIRETRYVSDVFD
ncbi:cytochrome P450 [Xylariaceae sp. FL0255]|nr:cytochrome P450 [Xylariaceae sp. FL0255]